MHALTNRRNFLRASTTASAALGLGDFAFLAQIGSVSAAETRLGPVRLTPDIAPLVRFLEDTPRNKLIEETAARIRRGLSYRDLLAALMLAGVRNIQPRPVGFKFHAVLVVNSAHLASLHSPDADRWLPTLWALDQFKSSQARDVQEGDWTMSAVDESAVPPAHRARAAFIEAMDRWDEAPADVAAAALARHLGAQECFELFARYGARDFRDIGHKAIYVANSWRTLQQIGWRHAESILRSLAYALLDRGNGPNPSTSDLSPDRPGRRNVKLSQEIRADWLAGKPDAAATKEMLAVLREADEHAACDEAAALLNRGAAPASLYDAFFQAAGEMLMRAPGIITLHAVTSTNAIHHAYQTSGHEETRRWLLLQNAAFLALFRQAAIGRGMKPGGVRIDELEPLSPQAGHERAVEEIFADVSRSKIVAAQKTLAWLAAGGEAGAFLDAARRLLFLKGSDSHDYKFASAALEDYFHLSAPQRARFLAASTSYLKGSGAPDTSLARRIRAAFGS